MGISLPIKASSIVVQQPIKRENNVFTTCSDIYGDDYFDSFETTTVTTEQFTTVNDEVSVVDENELSSSKNIIDELSV